MSNIEEARRLMVHAQYSNDGVEGFVAALLDQIDALRRRAAAIAEQRDILERMLNTEKSKNDQVGA